MRGLLLSLTLMTCLMLQEAKGQIESGSLTDSRDGKTYRTVTISIKLEAGVVIKRTWLADNLNFASENSYCYKNEPAYCDVFGRLYTWDEASKVCPEGWHLATNKEWQEVFNTYGGTFKAGPALKEGGASGLNIKFGGFGDPGEVYLDAGVSGNYWDAEGTGAKVAGLITVPNDIDEVFHVTIGNTHRNSCRCVKNY